MSKTGIVIVLLVFTLFSVVFLYSGIPSTEGDTPAMGISADEGNKSPTPMPEVATTSPSATLATPQAVIVATTSVKSPATTTVPSETNKASSTPKKSGSTVRTLPQTIIVRIVDYAYQPTTLTVARGDTVVWTNEDNASHTVTSEGGSELSSAYLKKGESFSHTFTSTGAFPYYCQPHTWMKATVVVK